MPTIKQKLAFKETLENGGIVGRAMKKANYKPSLQKNPKKLTESKGWNQLMDKYLSEATLAKKHEELLNATVLLQMHFPEYTSDKEIKMTIEKAGSKLVKTIISEVTYPGKKGKEDITVIKKIAYYAAPNTMTQDKALDKAYKLRGSYAAERKDLNLTGQVSLYELLGGNALDNKGANSSNEK